jgi:23S rRNA (cytidine2498-2'-O)-methyltransferase
VAAALTAYLAPEGFLDELLAELVEVEAVHERLVVCRGPEQPAIWVDNVWRGVTRQPFESIGKTAKALRERGRNWAHYPLAHHRRCTLIQEKLPFVSARPLDFGAGAPTAPLGSWTLTADGQLLFASDCSSPFANGAVRFHEDRDTPPNRAYLKLWEILTVLPEVPRPGDVCLDLGSSPGGWTWVLQGLGARVISVDKAVLERGIDRLDGVDFRQQSAFALEPTEVGPVDWLFCDIACYPERLLSMLHRWLDAGTCRNFACTIKLQGDTNRTALEPFHAIEGASIRHLWHNKHELTWSRTRARD